MKKKIGIALALLLVLVMTLSVTAHAMEPSQAIAGSRDGGTAISITDITPREGEPGIGPDRRGGRHPAAGQDLPCAAGHSAHGTHRERPDPSGYRL